jgi:GTP cyclohydrolase I
MMIDKIAVYDAIGQLLKAIGEDPLREGLVDTPARVMRAFSHLFSGYDADPAALLDTVFKEDADTFDGMIILKDIDFTSFCEHHCLPFYGKAHVAYIADGKVTGASKLARVVDAYARRLQIQERMTKQIAVAIQDTLHPKGVGVIVEAHHFCMSARGIEKENVRYITDSMLGAFKEQSVKDEFLARIK